MPGFDGTGPWGLGPRLGYGPCLGGGMLFNMVVLGVGAYFIGRLLFKQNKDSN